MTLAPEWARGFGGAQCSQGVGPQAARRPVRKDVDDLAAVNPLLHAPPERGCQQVAVRGEEGLEQLAPEAQEGAELLREHIVLADKVPRLRRHFLVTVAGLRHLAE